MELNVNDIQHMLAWAWHYAKIAVLFAWAPLVVFGVKWGASKLGFGDGEAPRRSTKG